MFQSTGYTTKGRKKILEFLEANKNRAVAASEILIYLDGLGEKRSPSTVYRFLDELVKDGRVIKRRDSQEESAVYQLVAAQCHTHLHMECSTCGKIFHLDCEFMKEIEQHFIERHGFLLECSSSVLRGMCNDCKTK